MENTKTHTPLYRYAGMVKRNWDNMDAAAKPYVTEMFTLDQITDKAARRVVASFLSAATKWRGDTAREVKKELKRIANYQLSV